MAETRRLFFALWPDPALQAAIATAARGVARQRAIGGREIPAERIHLTLLFLGDVTAKAEERLVAAATQVPGRSFHLSLEQAACFYRTRVFWLGPKSTPPRLGALWQ
ncbi:MAG: 2'-5' RNA ligase family protein, partial [Nevskiaceae bacterium]